MFLIFDAVAIIAIAAGAVAQNIALIFAGAGVGMVAAVFTIIAICKTAKEDSLIKKIDYLVDYDDEGKELQKYLFKYHDVEVWKDLLYFNIGGDKE